MSREDTKDFNAMMNNSKDMPKIVKITDPAGIKKWGGESMVIAPPLEYNEVMKRVPKGYVITTNEIRKYVANANKVDITCPLTAGIFINICAWASHQKDDAVAYWRTLKTNGELNPKYPGGVEQQKKKLESEGFKIIKKGTKNIKYFVDKYEDHLYEL